MRILAFFKQPPEFINFCIPEIKSLFALHGIQPWEIFDIQSEETIELIKNKPYMLNKDFDCECRRRSSTTYTHQALIWCVQRWTEYQSRDFDPIHCMIVHTYRNPCCGIENEHRKLSDLHEPLHQEGILLGGVKKGLSNETTDMITVLWTGNEQQRL